MKRLNKGRSSIELYETLENLRKVRDKYLEVIEQLKLKENIFVTDGNRSAELIASDIWNEVSHISIATQSH